MLQHSPVCAYYLMIKWSKSVAEISVCLQEVKTYQTWWWHAGRNHSSLCWNILSSLCCFRFYLIIAAFLLCSEELWTPQNSSQECWISAAVHSYSDLGSFLLWIQNPNWWSQSHFMITFVLWRGAPPSWKMALFSVLIIVQPLNSRNTHFPLTSC